MALPCLAQQDAGSATHHLTSLRAGATIRLSGSGSSPNETGLMPLHPIRLQRICLSYDASFAGSSITATLYKNDLSTPVFQASGSLSGGMNQCDATLLTTGADIITRADEWFAVISNTTAHPVSSVTVTVEWTPHVGVHDVLAYGAIPGDTTSDHLAIKAAIAAAESEASSGSLDGGAVVYLPPGQYLIGETLELHKSNVHIVGSGEGVTTLKAASGLSGHVLVVGPEDPGVENRPVDQVSVRDLSIDGDDTATHCLVVTNARRSLFSDLLIRGASDNGLVVTAVDGPTALGLTDRATESSYRNIQCRQNDGDGIDISLVKRCTFEAITSSNNGTPRQSACGIFLHQAGTESTQNAFIGVLMNNNTGPGLIVEGTRRTAFTNLIAHHNGGPGVVVRRGDNAHENGSPLSIDLSFVAPALRRNGDDGTTETEGVLIDEGAVIGLELLGGSIRGGRAAAPSHSVGVWVRPDNRNIRVSGTQFTSMSGIAVHLQGDQELDAKTQELTDLPVSQVLLSDLDITHGNLSGTTKHGIWIDGLCKEVAIDNCRLDGGGTTSGSNQFELKLGGSGSNTPSAVRVTDTRLLPIDSSQALDVDSTISTEVRFNGCSTNSSHATIVSVVASSSWDTSNFPVWAAGHLIEVSGSQPVTDLPNAPPGTEFRLWFPSATTVVETGNIQTIHPSPVTVPAGSVVSFVATTTSAGVTDYVARF